MLNLFCKSRGQIVTELGGWTPSEGSRQGLEIRARWGLSTRSRVPSVGRLGIAQPGLGPAGRPGHRPPRPTDCPTPIGCWGRIGGGDLHRQTFREADGLVEALGFSDRSEEVMERVMRCAGADHHRRAADG